MNGLKVVPDFSFDNHPPVDIFVIPGGVGTKAEMNKQEVLDWINKTYEAQPLPCQYARVLESLASLGYWMILKQLRIMKLLNT